MTATERRLRLLQRVGVFFRHSVKRKIAERTAVRAQALLQASIDAVSAHVVILDERGAIVAFNKAWKRFVTLHELCGSSVGTGSSYLTLFEGSFKHCDALKLSRGMAALRSGGKASVRLAYPLSLGGQMRWFRLNAQRFDTEGEVRIIVVNEDITEITAAQQALGELSDRVLVLQEEERQRIAEDLHDSTAQHLVAMSLSLMNLKARTIFDAQSSKLWHDIESSLNEAIKEVRTVAYLLNPPHLENDGLCSTLRRYVDGFGARTGLFTKLRVNGRADTLPLALQRSILRIVQEALANVHRHARAAHVSIDLRFLAERLHLLISDDGCGIKGMSGNGASQPVKLGVGIPGMRTRLRPFGGNLKIRSGSDGTTIHATVPSRTHASAAAVRTIVSRHAAT